MEGKKEAMNLGVSDTDILIFKERKKINNYARHNNFTETKKYY